MKFALESSGLISAMESDESLVGRTGNWLSVSFLLGGHGDIMPTYVYHCDACDQTFEVFQRMSEDPLTTCERCEDGKVRRLLSAGAGVIFKGSGFYETDYKRSSSDSSASESKSSESSAPSSCTGNPSSCACSTE